MLPIGWPPDTNELLQFLLNLVSSSPQYKLQGKLAKLLYKKRKASVESRIRDDEFPKVSRVLYEASKSQSAGSYIHQTPTSRFNTFTHEQYRTAIASRYGWHQPCIPTDNSLRCVSKCKKPIDPLGIHLQNCVKMTGSHGRTGLHNRINYMFYDLVKSVTHDATRDPKHQNSRPSILLPSSNSNKAPAMGDGNGMLDLGFSGFGPYGNSYVLCDTSVVANISAELLINKGNIDNYSTKALFTDREKVKDTKYALGIRELRIKTNSAITFLPLIVDRLGNWNASVDTLLAAVAQAMVDKNTPGQLPYGKLLNRLVNHLSAYIVKCNATSLYELSTALKFPSTYRSEVAAMLRDSAENVSHR